MNIHAEKIELIRLILETKKESVINKIKQILVQEQEDMSLFQKNAVDEAILSLEKGEGVLHGQVMEETKKRYSKYFKK